MKPTVHLLVTVRNEKMVHAALLVFKTLRIGFPTANLFVWGNGLTNAQGAMMQQVCGPINALFKNLARATHGKWIELLTANADAPFWICDTDVVFFNTVETFKFKPETLFAGRYEPEFREEWTESRHVARMHPSLMWFNPIPLRAAMRVWPGKHEFFGTVQREFFEWQFVPVLEKKKRSVHFYDTCAGLHHSLGGTPFTEKQNDCFEHIHCGTYADLISPHLNVDNLLETHRAIFQHPEIARGMRADQEKYYATRKI